MTLAEFRLNPELIESYSRWISHPIAEIAFALVRECHAPRLPPVGAVPISSEGLAALFAEQAGIVVALDTLKSLGPDNGASEAQVEDWGAESKEKKP